MWRPPAANIIYYIEHVRTIYIHYAAISDALGYMIAKFGDDKRVRDKNNKGYPRLSWITRGLYVTI